MEINSELIWSEVINSAFNTMLQNSQDMVFVKDINLRYVSCSKAFARMAGKESPENIIGLTDHDIFTDTTLADRYVNDDRKLISSGENLVDYIEPLTDIDGYPRYSSTSKYILRDKWGCAIGLLGISRDITREYSIQQHHQQELRYLFELPPDIYAAVFVDIDNWRIVAQRRQNLRGASLPPCHNLELLRTLALDSFMADSEEAKAFYESFSKENLIALYKSGKTGHSLKYRRCMTDGSVRWVRNDFRFLTDPESGHLCVMLSALDIEAEKKVEQEMIRAAEIDEMTGLYNRNATMKQIQKVLESDSDSIHVLMMVDVDNFKHLNDTLGHRTGDEFLIAFSNALKSCFREGDIVGRIGGDEFFVLMRGVSGVEAVRNKATSIMSSVQNVCSAYPSAGLSASVGVSFYPKNGRTIESLYSRADSALYQAKRKGKNQYSFA